MKEEEEKIRLEKIRKDEVRRNGKSRTRTAESDAGSVRGLAEK